MSSLLSISGAGETAGNALDPSSSAAAAFSSSSSAAARGSSGGAAAALASASSVVKKAPSLYDADDHSSSEDEVEAPSTVKKTVKSSAAKKKVRGKHKFSKDITDDQILPWIQSSLADTVDYLKRLYLKKSKREAIRSKYKDADVGACSHFTHTSLNQGQSMPKDQRVRAVKLLESDFEDIAKLLPDDGSGGSRDTFEAAFEYITSADKKLLPHVFDTVDTWICTRLINDNKSNFEVWQNLPVVDEQHRDNKKTEEIPNGFYDISAARDAWKSSRTAFLGLFRIMVSIATKAFVFFDGPDNATCLGAYKMMNSAVVAYEDGKKKPFADLVQKSLASSVFHRIGLGEADDPIEERTIYPIRRHGKTHATPLLKLVPPFTILKPLSDIVHKRPMSEADAEDILKDKLDETKNADAKGNPTTQPPSKSSAQWKKTKRSLNSAAGIGELADFVVEIAKNSKGETARRKAKLLATSITSTVASDDTVTGDTLSIAEIAIDVFRKLPQIVAAHAPAVLKRTKKGGSSTLSLEELLQELQDVTDEDAPSANTAIQNLINKKSADATRPSQKKGRKSQKKVSFEDDSGADDEGDAVPKKQKQVAAASKKKKSSPVHRSKRGRESSEEDDSDNQGEKFVAKKKSKKLQKEQKKQEKKKKKSRLRVKDSLDDSSSAYTTSDDSDDSDEEDEESEEEDSTSDGSSSGWDDVDGTTGSEGDDEDDPSVHWRAFKTSVKGNETKALQAALKDKCPSFPEGDKCGRVDAGWCCRPCFKSTKAWVADLKRKVESKKRKKKSN